MRENQRDILVKMAEWRKAGRLLFLLWLLILPEPNYLQSATTPQQVAPLDLFICLDSSSSIGEENYESLKAAVVRFLQQLPISEQGIHVGVRPFSWALSEQYVGLSSNTSALYDGVAGLPYMRGRTRTDLAIEDAVRQLTTYGRPQAAKAIAVLTDGMPTFPTDAMEVAKKAQSLDIEMFAVGFGSLISQAGLLILAPESNVFTQDSFDQVPDGLLSFAKTQLELQGTTASVNLTTSLEVSSATSRITAGSSAGTTLAASSMWTETTRNPPTVSTVESGVGLTSTGFSSVRTEITVTISTTAASAVTSTTTTASAAEPSSSTLRSTGTVSSATSTSKTTTSPAATTTSTTTAAAETRTETSLSTLRPTVPAASSAATAPTTTTTTASTSIGLTVTSASATTAFYSGNSTASVSNLTRGTAPISEPTILTTPAAVATTASTGAANTSLKFSTEEPTTGSTSALTSGRALSTMTSSRASEPASGTTSTAKTTLSEISPTTVPDRAASSSYPTLPSANPSSRPSSTSGAPGLETETTLPLSTTATTGSATSTTSHSPFATATNSSTASATSSANLSSLPTPTTAKSVEVTTGPGSTKLGESSSTVLDVSPVPPSSTTRPKSTTAPEPSGFTTAAISLGTATNTASWRSSSSSSTTIQREGTLSTADRTTNPPEGTNVSHSTKNATTTTMAASTTALPGSSSTPKGTATTGRPTPVSQGCEGGVKETPLSVGKATSNGSKEPTGGICDSPEVKVKRGVGFLSHPFNCGRFVQCYPAAGAALTAVTRVCGPGLFWNQELLRCDPATVVTCPSDLCLNEGVSHYKMEGNCRAFWRCQNGRSLPSCCGRGRAYFPGQGCVPCPGCKDDCPFSCTTKQVCGSKPDWLSPDGYYVSFGALGWLPATCSVGFFDVSQCACSLDSLVDLGCKLYLSLSFDEKESLSIPGMESVNVLQVNGIGIFLGDARLSFLMPFADILSRKADRPLRVDFRYMEMSPMEAGDRQVLVQSSPCALGGLLVLYLDNTALFVRIFNQQGEVASTEIFTEGFDILAWKNVRMRYSSSGGFVIKVSSKKLTYTSFIEVPPKLSVSDCGWTFGSPQGLDHLSSFTGGLDEIKISYC